MDFKKSIIFIVIGIILCASMFFGGYFVGRNRRVSSSGNEATELITELQKQLNNIQQKYEEQLRTAELLEQQLKTTSSGIDECLGITRRVNQISGEIGDESFGLEAIIAELGKRIREYEDRIAELDRNLSNIKASIDKQ